MKFIDVSTPTHPNAFAVVDDEDFDHLNQWKWTAVRNKKRVYAERKAQRSSIRMHRYLLGAHSETQIDHRDLNGLNNQKSNLRVCTRSENQCNRALQSNNKSGFIGVCWWSRDKNWRAQIKTNGINKNLGYYPTAEIAAKFRDEAAKRMHGAFARLNFPDMPEVTV